MELQLSIAEMNAFLADVFPQLGKQFEIIEMKPPFIRMTMRPEESDLRPGGTISGPSIFKLADCAYYIATLALIGREALTVTTNCSIDFMRKPKPGPLIAEARVLKLGKSLSVGDVMIYSEGMEAPVARASLTYSIPPKPAR